MFTVDTNALIYLAAGERKVAEFFTEESKNNAEFFLPTIVIAEYLRYTKLSEQDKQIFFELTNEFIEVDLNRDIAVFASEISKRFSLPLADSVIAATALETDSVLITRNVKDFKKVQDLMLQAI